MDIKFQDRIDDYLLNRMNDADRENFLQEVEQNEEKKEQLEFTKSVKDSVCSREEKLRALAQLQQQYETERKAAVLRSTGTECAQCCEAAPTMAKEKTVQSKRRMWLWISGIAAVFVVGFFAISPMFMYESSPNSDNMPMEQMRGGDDVFDCPDSTDGADNDTIKYRIDNGMMLDE